MLSVGASIQPERIEALRYDCVASLHYPGLVVGGRRVRGVERRGSWRLGGRFSVIGHRGKGMNALASEEGARSATVSKPVVQVAAHYACIQLHQNDAVNLHAHEIDHVHVILVISFTFMEFPYCVSRS
jgi:hypothetical protein